jgi:hypothetical protein
MNIQFESGAMRPACPPKHAFLRKLRQAFALIVLASTGLKPDASQWARHGCASGLIRVVGIERGTYFGL